jgi:hypothetical protein
MQDLTVIHRWISIFTAAPLPLPQKRRTTAPPSINLHAVVREFVEDMPEMEQDQGQREMVYPLVDMKFKVSIRGWKDNEQQAGVLVSEHSSLYNR